MERQRLCPFAALTQPQSGPKKAANLQPCEGTRACAKSVAGSEACLVKWKLCDEQSQTCPGPWDAPYGGCIGNAPAWIATVAGAGASAECSRTYPDLLSGTDAHDPAGRAAHCARARQTLCACHYRRLRPRDHDAAGSRPGLERLLTSAANGSSGGLYPIHRRRLREPDKRLFGGKLRCRSAD